MWNIVVFIVAFAIPLHIYSEPAPHLHSPPSTTITTTTTKYQVAHEACLISERPLHELTSHLVCPLFPSNSSSTFCQENLPFFLDGYETGNVLDTAFSSSTAASATVYGVSAAIQQSTVSLATEQSTISIVIQKSTASYATKHPQALTQVIGSEETKTKVLTEEEDSSATRATSAPQWSRIFQEPIPRPGLSSATWLLHAVEATYDKWPWFFILTRFRSFIHNIITGSSPTRTVPMYIPPTPCIAEFSSSPADRAFSISVQLVITLWFSLVGLAVAATYGRFVENISRCRRVDEAASIQGEVKEGTCVDGYDSEAEVAHLCLSRLTQPSLVHVHVYRSASVQAVVPYASVGVQIVLPTRRSIAIQVCAPESVTYSDKQIQESTRTASTKVVTSVTETSERASVSTAAHHTKAPLDLGEPVDTIQPPIEVVYATTLPNPSKWDYPHGIHEAPAPARTEIWEYLPKSAHHSMVEGAGINPSFGIGDFVLLSSKGFAHEIPVEEPVFTDARPASVLGDDHNHPIPTFGYDFRGPTYSDHLANKSSAFKHQGALIARQHSFVDDNVGVDPRLLGGLPTAEALSEFSSTYLTDMEELSQRSQPIASTTFTPLLLGEFDVATRTRDYFAVAPNSSTFSDRAIVLKKMVEVGHVDQEGRWQCAFAGVEAAATYIREGLLGQGAFGTVESYTRFRGDERITKVVAVKRMKIYGDVEKTAAEEEINLAKAMNLSPWVSGCLGGFITSGEAIMVMELHYGGRWPISRDNFMDFFLEIWLRPISQS
ncbi:hypothetical protein BDQ17DRAFT_238581 [Cyathus striatus]|nr:hypothetical protein BDQ17DRAFT_238581 [Cyathus striatus]